MTRWSCNLRVSCPEATNRLLKEHLPHQLCVDIDILAIYLSIPIPSYELEQKAVNADPPGREAPNKSAELPSSVNRRVDQNNLPFIPLSFTTSHIYHRNLLPPSVVLTCTQSAQLFALMLRIKSLRRRGSNCCEQTVNQKFVTVFKQPGAVYVHKTSTTRICSQCNQE